VNGAFDGLQTELASLGRVVQRVKAKHVNTRSAREKVRSCVRSYFENVRPNLERLVGEDAMGRLDNEMQALLRCTQHRTLVSDYRSLLNGAREAVAELELKSLGQSNTFTTNAPGEPRHLRILTMVETLCPSAAFSYEQALRDLRDGTRKSWRGTAVEFREALREVLDHLAPDNEVKKQTWFKQDPDTKGPTMKQKAVFILRSRHPRDPQIKAFTSAIDVVEESIGKFVRSVYTRSSTAVHVAETIDEVKQIRDYVSLVLAELLEVKD
jgi:RNA processing factor Prp31